MNRRKLLLLLASAALASCGDKIEPHTNRRGAVWARQDAYTALGSTSLQVFVTGDTTQHRVRWEESAPDAFLITELCSNDDERQCFADARGARPGANLGEMRDGRGALTVFAL